MLTNLKPDFSIIPFPPVSSVQVYYPHFCFKFELFSFQTTHLDPQLLRHLQPMSRLVFVEKPLKIS
jgi:hypothetical protein